MRRLTIQLIDGKVTRLVVDVLVAEAAVLAFDRYKRRVFANWRRSIVIRTMALSQVAVDLRYVAVMTSEYYEEDEDEDKQAAS